MTNQPIPVDDFKAPYAAAGHDVESVFQAPLFECIKCGSPQINLSEDLAYGPMRPCIEATSSDAQNTPVKP